MAILPSISEPLFYSFAIHPLMLKREKTFCAAFFDADQTRSQNYQNAELDCGKSLIQSGFAPRARVVPRPLTELDPETAQLERTCGGLTHTRLDWVLAGPPTRMSALPPKADIAERDRHVRFVPKADILRCGKSRAIQSPRRRHRIRKAAPADWRQL
jgi:hypothetical protein